MLEQGIAMRGCAEATGEIAGLLPAGLDSVQSCKKVPGPSSDLPRQATAKHDRAHDDMTCGDYDVRETAQPPTSPWCVRGLQRAQAYMVQGL